MKDLILSIYNSFNNPFAPMKSCYINNKHIIGNRIYNVIEPIVNKIVKIQLFFQKNEFDKIICFETYWDEQILNKLNKYKAFTQEDLLDIKNKMEHPFSHNNPCYSYNFPVHINREIIPSDDLIEYLTLNPYVSNWDNPYISVEPEYVIKE